MPVEFSKADKETS